MYNEPLTPLYGNRPPRRSHKKHNIILALSALVVPISLCVASTTALFPQEKSGYQIGTRGNLHQLCDSPPCVLSLALLRRLDLSGHDRTPRVL